MSIKIIAQQVNNVELERTPGMAAVSGSIRQDAGGGNSLPALPPTNPSPLPHYLDVGDNVHAKVQDWLQSNCGDNDSRWFIPGKCENGHRIAKIIVCGKEWCPVCGEKGSIAHNRRYVRWLDKIRQFKRMRYFVFTIPGSLRSQYRTKEDLTELGRRAQALLKRHGFKRGLRRWHWFGDRSHKWHPHLNILVEGGYLKATEVESIKKDWARVLGADVISARISYKGRPGDMVGCLYYVTRATFLDYEWDLDMAQELRGFRNMVVWGRDWQGEPVWDAKPYARIDRETGEPVNIEAVEKVVNHTCHVCGGHISWDKALPEKLLDLVDKESLGAGYYRLLDRPPPAELSEDIKARLRTMRLVWHAKTLGAVEIQKDRLC